MVTTNNLNQDTFNSKAEAHPLLDELHLILSGTRHLTIAYDDMLKYVHEKAACHNICKKGTCTKCAYHKKRLKGELLSNNAITRGGETLAF